jgi:hypothetical protein
MLAKPAGRLGEVLTFACAIDVVARRAIALAGDAGGAVLEQLHVARKHHLDGLVDAAVALDEHLLGLGGDVGHRLPKGRAVRGLGQVATDHVVPADFDFTARCSRWYHCTAPYSSQRVGGRKPARMLLPRIIAGLAFFVDLFNYIMLQGVLASFSACISLFLHALDDFYMAACRTAMETGPRCGPVAASNGRGAPNG